MHVDQVGEQGVFPFRRKSTGLLTDQFDLPGKLVQVGFYS
jgi:hypothetical protein